jgi:hypothetical protein
MPKIEIDEAEFNRLAALGAVASRIVKNPAALRRLEEAHKLVEPNAPTPALDAYAQQNKPIEDAKNELSEQIKALREEREAEKREANLRDLAGKQEKAFAKLKHEHRYTDEGIKAVRDLMEAKGLLDVDDAVAIFERSNPPQMPATPAGGMTGQSWGFIDNNDKADEDIKALIATRGDNDAIVERMAHRALNEFRAGH